MHNVSTKTLYEASWDYIVVILEYVNVKPFVLSKIIFFSWKEGISTNSGFVI